MSKYKTHSKYPYAPLESGAFFFPTDEGCYIMVSIEDSGYRLWQSNYLSSSESIFSISFERKCDDGLHDFDDAVCNTIYNIVTANMISGGHLGVYYHHWVEEEQYYEHLYNDFYDEMGILIPDFESFEFPWKDEDANPQITSVFIHKANPDKDLIIAEFTKTIGAIE